MKRLLIMLLLAVLLIQSAFAVGDPNIGIGGGGLGGGTSSSIWYGDEGVRITIVDAKIRQPVTTPIDLSSSPNYILSWYGNYVIHFGKVSKLSYNSGAQLAPTRGSCTVYKPEYALPKIISTNYAKANLETICEYRLSKLRILSKTITVKLTYNNRRWRRPVSRRGVSK